MAGHRALDLPPEFIRHNEEDPGWLRALPDQVQWLAHRWSLTLDRHFAEIAINYVAPATRRDGTRCVLKVSRHIGETRNEIAALLLWDGSGAARLLEADPDIGALLTERLDPGAMLVDVAQSDDNTATVIAADVLRQLWRPLPERYGLRPLESWCAAYERNREALSGGAAGFLLRCSSVLTRCGATSLPPPTRRWCSTATYTTSTSSARSVPTGSQSTRRDWPATAASTSASFCGTRTRCHPVLMAADSTSSVPSWALTESARRHGVSSTQCSTRAGTSRTGSHGSAA